MGVQNHLITTGAAFLSPAERRILLEEIGILALTLGRDRNIAAEDPVPVSPDSVRDLTAGGSPLERLRLLEALWQEMPSALSEVVRRLDTQPGETAVAVPLVCARGGPGFAQKVARTPGGQAAWREAERLRQGDAAAAPMRTLAEKRPCSTTVTTANRFVVSLLQAMAWEAEALARLAAFCGETAEAERITEVAEAAARWGRHPAFDALLPLSEAERQGLPGVRALRSLPAYRVLFHSWSRLKAELYFDWSGSPLLALPPLEPWNLYEIWCFLRVGEALQEAGWRCQGGEALRWEANGLRLVLAAGQASRLVFAAEKGLGAAAEGAKRGKRGAERLELFYQPLFLSANRRVGALSGAEGSFASGAEWEGGFASLTHAMQPDIGLLRGGRWYLLDPKFRTYAEAGAEQEDVDKMHTYRDAIVRRGSLRRAVVAAWCLFPGEAAQREFSAEIAVRAYPGATAERPFGSAGIGALRLRPGDPASALWLTRWIRDKMKEG